MKEISIKSIIKDKKIDFYQFEWTNKDREEWNKIMREYYINQGKMYKSLRENPSIYK